ncbi:MAG: CDP-alcohol phosphatidyltransferase family protein [Thermoguttaceae bacterium]|nr:CDP-alcohol phosphatidyltransferase family protein [Thermoguttaceae bacterium]
MKFAKPGRASSAKFRQSSAQEGKPDISKRKIVGFYDYTVVLTYCGMLCAFCGILRAVNREFWEAMICLMLAGICDMFDGAVASTKNRNACERRFGIQIDSLSDLISFGVLPGIFVYVIAEQTPLAGVVAALFVLCALIRLAYFNVLEEERQNQTSEKRKSYIGVPVTTVAITMPIAYMMYDYSLFKTTACFPILLLLMGAGFISPVEIKKPGTLLKMCLILLGVLEVLGMMFLMTWGEK